MSDFEIFYHAAQCFIHGQSPYNCAAFFYPLPTLFLFLPLTAFPLAVAKMVWALLMLICFVITLKRRAVWFALYVPALQAFWQGQIDLVLLPALALATGPAMALLTLKPQLIWLYLPIWFYGASWRERRLFLAVAGTMWGGSVLVQPGWVFEFLTTTRPMAQAAYASPSLWGGGWLPAVAVLVIGCALIWRNRRSALAATTAVNPALITYDLVVLLPGARWWLVPLSWITQYMAIRLGMAAPHALLSLAAYCFGQAGWRRWRCPSS